MIYCSFVLKLMKLNTQFYKVTLFIWLTAQPQMSVGPVVRKSYYVLGTHPPLYLQKVLRAWEEYQGIHLLTLVIMTDFPEDHVFLVL